MRRMTFATLLAALLIMTMGMGGAIAAPENNPRANWIELNCDDEVNFEAVITGRGAGFVVDSTQRLIPHEFRWMLWVDDEPVAGVTGGNIVGKGNKQGLQGRLIECEQIIPLDAENFTDEDWELLKREGVDVDKAEKFELRQTITLMVTPAR
jgi:hypothetical protein